MFQLLYPLVRAIEPFLIPLCFCFAWGLVILCVLTIWSAMRESLARAKRMHQIPCAYCQFFTNDHRLKCTVNPSIASSEKAINCRDYCRSQYADSLTPAGRHN